VGTSKLIIASDHAGWSLKSFLKAHLPEIQWLDLGPEDNAPVDYPDFAQLACRSLLEGKAEKAVLICGTGLGMSIAANRFAGIRAAHVESLFSARFAAEHNAAQVLCLGERVTAPYHALEMVKVWLATPFSARHKERLDKIESGKK
jgi:ribose 5-phosphate isomerase B